VIYIYIVCVCVYIYSVCASYIHTRERGGWEGGGERAGYRTHNVLGLGLDTLDETLRAHAHAHTHTHKHGQAVVSPTLYQRVFQKKGKEVRPGIHVTTLDLF
jgi:hypothetical protein